MLTLTRKNLFQWLKRQYSLKFMRQVPTFINVLIINSKLLHHYMNVCYKTLLWIFENFCLRLSYFCFRKPWYSFSGMMDQWRTFMLTCRCCLSTRSSYTALWGCMRRESSGSPVVVVGYLEPLWRKSKR